MTNRRDFLKQIAAAGVAASIPSTLFSQGKPSSPMIWANLLHLSYNMWEDHVPPQYRDENYACTTCKEARAWAHPYQPFLTFDEAIWNILLNDMVGAGMNMVVIDLGDAVVYDSHPEIAVKNAWSPGKLRSELKKIRALGLEPIPKLNFATTHDAWMGEYSRMVSSQKYYDVCRDLIKEVIELFDHPRLFHLGMDEETAAHQVNMQMMMVRQKDLWWHDFYFFVDEVEKGGARPWVWSDYAWEHPDLFFQKMPKSVLQSNWYYGDTFDPAKMNDLTKIYTGLYEELEKRGYDQVPTGSAHSNNVNMEATVDYCMKTINSPRLLGFMTAPWRPTLAPCLEYHKETIAQIGRSIKKYS